MSGATWPNAAGSTAAILPASSLSSLSTSAFSRPYTTGVAVWMPGTLSLLGVLRGMIEGADRGGRDAYVRTHHEPRVTRLRLVVRRAEGRHAGAKGDDQAPP